MRAVNFIEIIIQKYHYNKAKENQQLAIWVAADHECLCFPASYVVT